MLTNIKWIFFDVGYTLVNEDKVWDQRCREQAMTKEAQALGLTANDIMQALAEATQSYLPQYRTVVQKYRFQQVAPYRSELEFLYPQAKEVLKQLSAQYKLGVIANQSDGLRQRLTDYGIIEYFSCVISSWDHHVLKPDPELFRVAFREAGCQPEEAAMVGDRLDNDIFPAKALGMKTIWIKQGFGGMQTPKSPEYEPTKTITSLDELLTL